ncbi:MAG: hypothetical protein WCG83_06475 [Candidatus Peregrinibacteria bacterium]
MHQKVIRESAFWLFIVPGTILGTVSSAVDSAKDHPEFPALTVLNILLALPLIVLSYWGMASILVAGRRLLKSSAGRTRTSFRAVRKAATHFVLPLLFTDILRTAHIILWSLLLIIPGIIAFLRTILIPVIIISEGRTMRAALRRSQEILRGRLLRTLWYMIAFGGFLFLPAVATDFFLLSVLQNGISLWMILIRESVISALYAIATTLFLLCLILLYKEWTKKTNA